MSAGSATGVVLRDPVCGMTVDASHARHLAEHDGIVYAFCTLGCRTRFIRDPSAFVSSVSSPAEPA
jgi:Cu+-exporting ATPase